MEFSGKDYIYLSKIKKEKIKKLKNEENNKENKKEAPPNLIQPVIQKDSLNSEDSDDEYIVVQSNNFNIDLEKSNIDNQSNLNAAPGINFKKAVDTNVCVLRYISLEVKSERLPQLYQCQKCNAYLNKYSNLIPLSEKDKYEWKCEFCFNINKDLYIEKENLPKNDCVEKILEKENTTE